jgi:hypothetical protein
VAGKQQPGSSGTLLTREPTVWTFAAVILLALAGLALLRHFFGSIRVDFAAGSK